ncbi:cell division protein ZapA [Shimia isoporae]|uniref:Cell division protein ZapA n=1 Tax=Shimia isoporae TaxID=647720 RepID=A0A4R1NX00_9RHOB|nr:cell division protein ZapA [Shimia isoporae]TCL09682.1 cell division protein ZapA [Shimia isoporae]
MPEVQIEVGGRIFEVACQEGEQHFLESAAKMLDAEARVLVGQAGRVPEARMLLMSGLMLADKTAGVEDKLREMEAKLAAAEKALEEVKAAGPEQVEVAVVPSEVTDKLAELAARAEAVADLVEEKAG